MRPTKRTLKEFGPRRVLIIDDDTDLLMSIKDYFELEAYEVLLARNGKEALDLLASVDEKSLPDLIFLDHMMPVMDGTAFSRTRRSNAKIKDIPVILTTASTQLRHLMHEVDADAFLQKPLDIDQIRDLSLNFIHRRSETAFGYLV